MALASVKGLKKASRREQKLASKPWLTSELLKQIKIKNTLSKQFIKNQNEECNKQYKIFRNQLNRLIKQSKVLYYQILVDASNGNSRETWKIIFAPILNALSYFLKLTLAQGNLPAQWKTAIVVPMYKKVARNLPSSYRLISLTCVMCTVVALGKGGPCAN